MRLYLLQGSTEVPESDKQYSQKAIYPAQNGFPLLFKEKAGTWAPISPSSPYGFQIFQLARFFSQINLMEFPIQLIS